MEENSYTICFTTLQLPGLHSNVLTILGQRPHLPLSFPFTLCSVSVYPLYVDTCSNLSYSLLDIYL